MMSRTNRLCAIVLSVLFSLLPAAPLAAERSEFEPDWESLGTREVPAWYPDAKFGILVCWGIYSVPSWAPGGMYAEWYWYWMGVGSDGLPGDEPSETWNYHERTFGAQKKYHDFASDFTAQNFDPDFWAELFREAGANYVVLTSKHHDGYCLFESSHANRSWGRPWNSVDIGPERDLLGDLGDSVRQAGLRMGLYFSLYEWFNPLWMYDREAYVEKHMIPQFKDVVSRYRPSLIFSDGEWDIPSANWKSEELVAWVYNHSDVPDDVVVNDRWGNETRHVHGDYFTTEYTTGMDTGDHPWEENRGMGHSYGFNRNENLEDYRTSRELVLILVDMVSRGGNLLLNVGPTGDGRIPVIMQQRLLDMGDWLKVNGEAIYGTRTWERSKQWTEGEIPQVQYGEQFMIEYDVNDVTRPSDNGKAVVRAFFTHKSDTLYAIAPMWPKGELLLEDIPVTEDTVVTLLGHEGALNYSINDGDLSIDVPELTVDEVPCQHAWTFRISNIEQY